MDWRKLGQLTASTASVVVPILLLLCIFYVLFLCGNFVASLFGVTGIYYVMVVIGVMIILLSIINEIGH